MGQFFPSTTNATGFWTLKDARTAKLGSNWPGVKDGLTPETAADSAAQILAGNPSAASGNYYIFVNGTAKQVYCDMTNDGGGWMLWNTFGTAAYQAGYAILPDNTNDTTFTANQWTRNTGTPFFGTNYIEWGLSCSAQGYIQTNAIGATLNITPTQLRTQFRNNHSISQVDLIVNNSTIATASAATTVTSSSVSINFSGTTPVLRYLEYNAIPRLYWAFLK
jgi:hypothetical protein